MAAMKDGIHPRAMRSRDPRAAAPFMNIVPEVPCLRAQDIPAVICFPHGVALQCGALHSDKLNFIAKL